MSDPATVRAEAATLAGRVYALVRACPPGRVTTYGWLAAAIGQPRGARMVGWFMNKIPKGRDVPAQRVINSKGELTGSWAFGERGRMRALLEAEGVAFDDAGRVDLKRYGWNPATDLAADERARILGTATQAPDEVDDDLLRLLLDDPASPFRLTRPAE
ncbi:MAG TPA: MGMT family protein [Ktedonobacterales bacterium]|jgi:methylated-DNA-protein-cysteine methyltransferase-like protein